MPWGVQFRCITLPTNVSSLFLECGVYLLRLYFSSYRDCFRWLVRQTECCSTDLLIHLCPCQVKFGIESISSDMSYIAQKERHTLTNFLYRRVTDIRFHRRLQHHCYHLACVGMWVGARAWMEWQGHCDNYLHTRSRPIYKVKSAIFILFYSLIPGGWKTIFQTLPV